MIKKGPNRIRDILGILHILTVIFFLFIFYSALFRLFLIPAHICLFFQHSLTFFLFRHFSLSFFTSFIHFSFFSSLLNVSPYFLIAFSFLFYLRILKNLTFFPSFIFSLMNKYKILYNISKNMKQISDIFDYYAGFILRFFPLMRAFILWILYRINVEYTK